IGAFFMPLSLIARACAWTVKRNQMSLLLPSANSFSPFLWRERKPISTLKWLGWCALGTASAMMSFSYTDDSIRKIAARHVHATRAIPPAGRTRVGANRSRHLDAAADRIVGRRI